MFVTFLIFDSKLFDIILVANFACFTRLNSFNLIYSTH